MAGKNDKKKLIIDAAIRVFAGKGFYNSKVADVAHAAGVADGTIYLYFKNKDDLLISLFETKMEEILKRFRIILEQDISPPEKLTQFIHLHFKMIEEDKDLAEVFQVELRQSSKFLKDYHNQKFIDFLAILEQIIREGRDEGYFRPDVKINTMKIAIFGALDELAREWILGADHHQELKGYAAELAGTFIRGLAPVSGGKTV
jgi:TetR/AcrR family fatty acid metabolism transcriptional regulator